MKMIKPEDLTDEIVREEKARAMGAWDNTLVGHCNIWLSWSAGHEDARRAQLAACQIADAINARGPREEGVVMERSNQWTRMCTTDGSLTLSVRVNDVDCDIVFAGHDLDDLHKNVVAAVAQRLEQRTRAQEGK